MNGVRFMLIRGVIAQVLKASGNWLVPETTLFNFTRPSIGGLGQAEFDHVILRMEQERHIIRVPNEDEGVKAKLTELGEAELLS